MPADGSSGFIRIASNYARLLTTLVFGLILVPIQLNWFGKDAIRLIGLLTSSVGLAATAVEVMDRSMIRELGAAYHDADPKRFARIYNAAFIVSAGGALVVLLCFGILLALLPVFNIPAHLVTAAHWLLASEAAIAIGLTLVAPVFNIYLVTERFALYNLFVVVQRASYLVPAVVLYVFMKHRTDPDADLRLYAIWCAIANLSTLLIPVLLAVGLHRRFLPRPWLADRGAIREIMGTFSWNSAMVLAISMPDRVCAILGKLVFPLQWNAVYALSIRGVGYVRMVTFGMTTGLDAVSARMSAGERRDDAVRSLVRHATRLHAFTAIPACLGMFILAEPIFELWIGRNVDNPEAILPPTILMVRILIFFFTIRSISDAWLSIIYGAGKIRQVAPYVIVGGALAPILAIILIFVLPDPMRENGPAAALSLVFSITLFVVFPVVGARCLSLRVRDLMMPIVRPAIAAAVCSPVLLGALALTRHWTLTWLVMIVLAYGLAYGAATWLFVLDDQERRRFGRAFGERLGRRRPEPAPPRTVHRGGPEELDPTLTPTNTGL